MCHSDSYKVFVPFLLPSLSLRCRGFVGEAPTGAEHTTVCCSLYWGPLWLSVIVSSAKAEGFLMKAVATLTSEEKNKCIVRNYTGLRMQ